MEFGYKKEIGLAFDAAVEKLRELLAEAGLGVITEIDAKETFKKKLGIDSEEYLILGVCHPETAYKVLEAEKDMGLMLPCNVVIYKKDGKVYVSAILPTALLGMVDNKDLMPLAREVEQKLRSVVDSL